ncbi:toll/interleukin-1 receptor domain-containing protein [Amycolatopsis aidingensis]|uniref:toll/interleukin-1 receptor domain-containing protein n=1 Tax=Amycolatopsis aidingensis TaxID=2842453 RepID=UPI001C0C6753|nr:toll/interleukin-1 receptor domain-containing protein [Amycolatopsis aidingensis]
MQVTISYAHDDWGRAISQALVLALRQRGVDVLWDRDLPADNPTSLPEWIVNGVAGNPVICVLSPDYVRRFGRGDASAERKGVLFESRILLRRIFDHTEPEHCPVVPVADPGFSADLAPVVLKNLVIARFDPVSGDGVDVIVRRLLRLRHVHTADPGPAEIETNDVRPASPRSPRQVLRDLEATSPSTVDGLELVREWLSFAGKDEPCRAELTGGFSAIERIVKSAGDVNLMRVVSDRCLSAFPAGTLSDEEKQLKAKILIRGRAWHLYRAHELRAAEQAVHEGVELAKECGDRWLLALGRGSLGVLHHAIAVDSAGSAAEYHLDRAEDHAEAAGTMFAAMAGAGYQAGVCTKLLAQVWFSRHHRGQRGALRQASKLADRAVCLLAPDRARQYHELLILRAEIAVARGELSRAREFIGRAMGSLARYQADGASYVELLGCAHLARARLLLKEDGRDARREATKDAEIALKLFAELDLTYAVAGCRWLLIRLAPEPEGIYRGDVKMVERLFPDPRERLRAVEERARRIEEKAGNRWSRQAEWQDIVRKVRHHD